MVNKPEIIYITGNGHSGSTLLDIILGSDPQSFSSGELTFICREGILEEYCSCHQKISTCEIWQSVWKIWRVKKDISYKEYQKLRLKYERNKKFLTGLANRINPSIEYLSYCRNTGFLFEAIVEVTGKNVIIDSSKAPTRIPVLARNSNLKVLHILRDFAGVLNSAKKGFKKDIKAGYEQELRPRDTLKTLFDWLLTNILCELFCIGTDSVKIRYKDYVKNLESLKVHNSLFKGINSSMGFSTGHMLAGNANRMKGNIKINPTIGSQNDRLSDQQKRLANVIDSIFFFWS